jgi:hypothetical protein
MPGSEIRERTRTKDQDATERKVEIRNPIKQNRLKKERKGEVENKIGRLSGL